MSRSVVLSLAVVLLAAAAPVARAQKRAVDARTEQRAVERYERGKTHYDLGEYAQAITAWKEGYELNGDPVFLINLGLAYKALNDFERTIFFYNRFLRVSDPADPLHAKAEAAIVELEKLIEERNKVREQPPTEPQPVTIAPPAPAPVPPVERVVTVVLPPAQDRPPDPWYADSWGWVLAGAGVLCIGIGTYAFVQGRDLEREAEQEPDHQRVVDIRDEARGDYMLGTILTVAGSAALAGGVLKLVFTDGAGRRDEVPPRTAFGCGLGFCGVSGTF